MSDHQRDINALLICLRALKVLNISLVVVFVLWLLPVSNTVSFHIERVTRTDVDHAVLFGIPLMLGIGIVCQRIIGLLAARHLRSTGAQLAPDSASDKFWTDVLDATLGIIILWFLVAGLGH